MRLGTALPQETVSRSDKVTPTAVGGPAIAQEFGPRAEAVVRHFAGDVGRATGLRRQAPGVCIHIFSPSVFEVRPDFH